MRSMVMAVLFFVGFGVVAYAHPPQEITATFNKGKMEIVVVHPVSGQIGHYIKTIIVRQGENILAQDDFSSQEGQTQNASYTLVGLKSADRITVEAQCSLFGSKQIEIAVP
jgi:hypothetical protein